MMLDQIPNLKHESHKRATKSTNATDKEFSISNIFFRKFMFIISEKKTLSDEYIQLHFTQKYLEN